MVANTYTLIIILQKKWASKMKTKFDIFIEMLEVEIKLIVMLNKNDSSFDNGLVNGLRMAINRAILVDKNLQGE